MDGILEKFYEKTFALGVEPCFCPGSGAWKRQGARYCRRCSRASSVKPDLYRFKGGFFRYV